MEKAAPTTVNWSNVFPSCYGEYVQYNTGDQIWLVHDDITPQTMVVSIITHDGIYWNNGDQTNSNLTGINYLMHKYDMLWFQAKRFFKHLRGA